MNKPDYYRAVLLGVVVGMSFVTLLYLVGGMVGAEKQPTTPKSNFVVLDRYEGRCNVLQWEGNGSFAEYKYFLDCTK